MADFLRHINVHCADPYGLAGFWQEVTGWSRADDDFPGDPAAVLIPPDGSRPWLLFEQVPEAKTVPNRVHLDIAPLDGPRDEEVERLLGLGAILVADRRRPDGTGWAVLADPEGNEFCVERSDAERAAALSVSLAGPHHDSSPSPGPSPGASG
jgi:predicted enzyme related to lactoylglutathione lyase